MPEAYGPTPEDVHALIPQIAAGRSFSESTVPTVTQVVSIIKSITDDVESFVGDAIPDEHHDLARITIAHGAAAEIQRALFPESTGAENSMFQSLRQDYRDYRDRLASVVGDAVPSDEAGAAGPRGAFPTPVSGIPTETFEPLGQRGF